jgi:cytoskeletal protein RodZ
MRIVSRITKFYSPSVEELHEEEELLEEFFKGEPSSLNQGLVELRQKFTDEEERRRDIESKAEGILAISGVLLALLQFRQEFVGRGVLILFAFLLLGSILLSLANLVPVGYMAPHLSSILDSTFEQEEEYTRQLYLKYHRAIFNNQEVNESRLRVLRWSYYPIVLVILLLAGILIFVPSVKIARNLPSLLT